MNGTQLRPAAPGLAGAWQTGGCLGRRPALPHRQPCCSNSSTSNSGRWQRGKQRRTCVAVAAAADGRSSSKPDLMLLRILGAKSSPSAATWASGSTDDGGADASGSGAAAGTRQGIIDPNNPLYRAWWGCLIGAAAFTGIFVPWEWGFGWDDMYSLSSPANWVDLGLVGLFVTDIAVSHFVAYETDEMMVDEPGAIAANYRRQRLALDVLSAIPFDWIAFGLAAALASAAAAVPEAADAALQGSAAVAAGGAATAAAATAAAAAGAAAGTTAVTATASLQSMIPAIACLKGLHLVRLYRVRWFFRYLEYDLTVSLLTVTVARNLVIVLYLTHWVACGFNFLARSGGYDPNLLIGLNPDLFSSISQPEQYLYSLYWSVTTLAGNEWNGMDAVTDMRQVEANTARASVFLLFNIALGAYILGTITLLVVKNDERTGRYRDLSSNLKTYSMLNDLPAELKDEMQSHLKLKFNHQEASDEQVLSIYPTTIRRRILRHLYLRHLRASYLFRGTPRKFLDSLLSASRLELFRPGVDLLAAGDAVNELFVVVAGKVELRSPLDPSVSQYDWGGEFDDSLTSLTSLDPLNSMLGDTNPDSTATPGGMGVYMGPRKLLGPGELFGEISFFTEIPQMETVRSLTTVRVMVISRGAFDSVERNFPIASRLVLENLRRRSESLVAAEFPGIGSNRTELQQLLASCPSSLMYSWASPELVELMTAEARGGPASETAPFLPAGSSTDSSGSSLDTPMLGPSPAAAVPSGGSMTQLVMTAVGAGSLTARQELVLSNLVRVLAVINQHVAKQEEDRTTDFLYAATRGDVLKLRSMLQQGFNPDSRDYDGRTALMLACVRGHRDVVDLLLSAGANPQLDDNLGRSALLEACYHGHDFIIDTLLAAGVRLAPSSSGSAGGSSSLMGSDSDSSGMRMSVSGSARSNISGSGGAARFDSPARIGNRDMAAAGDYGSLSDESDSSSGGYSNGGRGDGSSTSWSLQLASLLCNCVYECNLPLLRRLLRAGAAVNLGDYDNRTALHISAAEGNSVMVRVLVEEGGADLSVQDRWRNTPLDEAKRVGATPVIKYLEAAAAALAQQAQHTEQQCADTSSDEECSPDGLPGAAAAGGGGQVTGISMLVQRQQRQMKKLQEQHAEELRRQQQLLQGQQVRAQMSSWHEGASPAAGRAPLPLPAKQPGPQRASPQPQQPQKQQQPRLQPGGNSSSGGTASNGGGNSSQSNVVSAVKLSKAPDAAARPTRPGL